LDVLFLHGPAAAGKHTIGGLLSTLVDMPLFHNHLVVDTVSALFDFGTEPFIQLREEMWLSTFRIAADASRSFIFTFNPEATVEVDLIERLEALVHQRGGRVWYVELRCSDAAVQARINSPSRAQFGKLRDPDVYVTLKQQGHFDFPPLPDALISIDTEAAAPIEAARMIADAYASVK
jgi:hypothetical protein